jgi:outer membrane murein-binding lipoprotein Lpp
MSNSQAYDEVTVAADGVTVTKRFEADEFPVPAIAFNLTSRRSVSVTVRLVDTVPEDVAVEDLGFHPEYGSEYWDINENRIAFEKELEPEADYTTVYGIRATGTDDVEKFLTEPEIESVDPPLDEDEGDLVGGDDEAVRDVIAGDADSVPGLEDDDDEDIETLDLSDPKNPDASVEAPEESNAAPADSEVQSGAVVATMAQEIRDQNVSPEDVKLLKRALDAVSEDDSDAGGVNDARIQRIQGDVADLRAYTDALEEFLEENGTGEDMIQEFGERLDSFEATLEDFEGDIQSATDTATSASDQVNGLSEEVESVEGQLDDLEDDIEAVRGEIDDGELADRIDETESEIEELKEWREQLSSVIGGGE